MKWSGEMKLKPETAQEVNDCADPRGMRKRLQEYAYRGGEPMVKMVLDSARYQGLSGEDTMTWLAFEALKGLEYLKALHIEKIMLEAAPPMIPGEKRTESESEPS